MSTFDFYDPPSELADKLKVDLVTEFYETPAPFTKWLIAELAARVDLRDQVILEPCVGNGAIADQLMVNPRVHGPHTVIAMSDLDTRWPATYHGDATQRAHWDLMCAHLGRPIDWTITNPPFEAALEILTHALACSHIGVAMYLRASIHEVLKGRRRGLADHPPTGVLWLPRFAHQRSKTTGKWSTDSVAACWCVWLKSAAQSQFIHYAPQWVLEDLAAFTPAYRRRMDALMADRRTT